MAYFPNGTAGEMYEAAFCDRCVHQEGGCAAWLLHLLWNYEAGADETKRQALDALIPQRGVENLECVMFYGKEV